MSATVINLIPTIPEYVPTAKSIEMIDEWYNSIMHKLLLPMKCVS